MSDLQAWWQRYCSNKARPKPLPRQIDYSVPGEWIKCEFSELHLRLLKAAIENYIRLRDARMDKTYDDLVAIEAYKNLDYIIESLLLQL